VLTGLDFLRRVNAHQPVWLGASVAVIGGGNTAVDCARAAVRCGARATVVYRRTERDMPAIREEVVEARHEGVTFEFEKVPIRVIPDPGSGLVTLESRQTRQDNGVVIDIAGTETRAEFSTVITAIGEEADVAFLQGTSINTNGHINAAFAGKTAAAGLFACGDAAFGYGTAGQAIASGRKTADAVSLYLNSIESKR
jgi:NADPH-dependent glutamate synthase beta subunit-like oxidoreductase